MDDHNVPGEIHGLAELLLLEIRPVAVAQERCARLAEVPDFVAVPQHFLQPHRIAFVLPVIQPHPIRDTVSHTGNLDLGFHLRLPTGISRSRDDQQGQEAREDTTPCHR